MTVANIYAQAPTNGRKITDEEMAAGTNQMPAWMPTPAKMKAAMDQLMGSAQGSELLPQTPFRGPVNPYDPNLKVQPYLPANPMEFNAGMAQPPAPRQFGASGSWGDPEPVQGAGGAQPVKGPALPNGAGGAGVAAKKAEELPAGTVADPTALVDDDKELGDLKKMIDGFESKKKFDLSPALALVDSWTGSNLQKGYDRPLSDEERERIVIGLRETAMTKEADMKYKKAYLASMAKQDQTRKDLKAMDNATDLQKANIMAASRTKAPDPGKVQDRLMRNNKGLATYVAQQRFGNKANPKDKSFKELTGVIHQEALEIAENAVENNDAPDIETGYQMAMQAMVQESQSGRQRQAEDEKPQGGW